MRAFADLLLPHACPCGAPAAHPRPGERAGPLCAECRRLLVVGSGALVRPYPRPRGLPPCSTAAAYAGGARRCLIAYKERGRRDLAPVLALALIKALHGLAPVAPPPGPVVLVPVPASRAALRVRGFDHVALLVQWMVRLMPQAPDVRWQWSPLLHPIRRVADQAGLAAGARARNVAGSMGLRAGVGRRVMAGSPGLVLVDDVMTSGATLAEAARALRAGGLRPWGGLVVAAVFRSDGEGRSALPSRGKTG